MGGVVGLGDKAGAPQEADVAGEGVLAQQEEDDGAGQQAQQDGQQGNGDLLALFISHDAAEKRAEAATFLFHACFTPIMNCPTSLVVRSPAGAIFCISPEKMTPMVSARPMISSSSREMRRTARPLSRSARI